MATLYERNGTFYINYTANGQRIRRTVGKDKLLAEMRLQEVEYRLARGETRLIEPCVDVLSLFSEYLRHCRKSLSPNTVLRYENAVGHFSRFLKEFPRVKYVGQLNKPTFRDYTISRQSSSPRPKAQTINLELKVIRSALNFAVENDWLEENPAKRLKMLRATDSKAGRALTPEEVEKLIANCHRLNDRGWFKQVLLVFLGTGLRRGELVNLEWSDVDSEENAIRIREKAFWSPKSYGRNIPISETVRSVLQSLPRASNTSFVFHRKGNRVHGGYLRKQLVRLAELSGLPHISRIHDLRHTFASMLLMAGVDIPTVQALLGHKSWTTTIIYSHQTKEHTQSAIEKLSIPL